MKQLTLISGAAGGIGSCISQHMLQKKRNLLLLDNDPNLLEELKSILHFNGQDIFYELVDIRDNLSVKKVVQKYQTDFKIDTLINCAGISVDGTSEIDYQLFRKMMDVNFWGCFNTIAAVLPSMCQQEYGYIINIVSQSGKRARAKTGAYAATKFALMGYIEGLQKELANCGIKISALCPGMVNTRQTDDEPDYDKQKMIQPQELLNAIDFLLSIPANVSVKEVIYECVQQIKE